MSNDIPPRLVRTNPAARYIGVSAWKLRRLVAECKIAPIIEAEGCPWLFDVRDLDAYVEHLRAESAILRGRHEAFVSRTC